VTADPDRALAVRLAETYAGEGAGNEYLALPPDIIRTVIRIAPTKLTGPAA
jgi:hypothetical protein